eukprot:COSAG02_NODE_474_length_21578_cov_225.787746_7_plen_103_part_00
MAKKGRGKAKGAKPKPKPKPAAAAAAEASSLGGVYGAVQFAARLKAKRSARHGTTEVREALLLCGQWRACQPIWQLLCSLCLPVIDRCVASPAASSSVCVGG